MALVLKNGAIFLHIPKTGGNFITEILEKCDVVDSAIGHKHCDVDRLCTPMTNSVKKIAKYWFRRRFGGLRHSKNRFGENTPFMFCFVRHPLRWYESWFKYQTQPSRNWMNWGDEANPYKWHPNAALNGTGDADFNRFVENVIAKRPGYVSEMFSWYTKPPVAMIGRQENLVHDLVRGLKEAGLEFDENLILNYPRVGVSPEPPKKIVWDSDLRDEVLRLEYPAIVRYGYATGDSAEI